METEGDFSVESQNVSVFLRLRPLNPFELNKRSRKVVEIVDAKKFTVDDPVQGDWEAELDGAFDDGVSSKQVYEQSCSDVAEKLVDGFNCSIAAYGASGTGKSETIKNILPRLASDIFSKLDSGPDGIEYTVRVSVIEVYLDRLRDLLHESSLVKIRHNGSVVGCTAASCVQSSDVSALIERAASVRTCSAALPNRDSNRSSLFFQITLEQFNPQLQCSVVSNLQVFDLAASELSSADELDTESTMVAQSLKSLQTAVRDHKEWENSGISPTSPENSPALLRLMQRCWGGDAFVTVILTASPSHHAVMETVSTLKFGLNFRDIRTYPSTQVVQRWQEGHRGVQDIQLHQDRLEALVRSLADECRDQKSRAGEQFDTQNKNIWSVIATIPSHGAERKPLSFAVEGSSEHEIRAQQFRLQTSLRKAQTERESKVAENEQLRSDLAIVQAECASLRERVSKESHERSTLQTEKSVLESRLETLGDSLTSAQFREKEAVVFLRQIRRFYFRLLKRNAAEGTGDTKAIVETIPGAPDLEQLVDMDRIMFESGLLEAHEIGADASAKGYRPSESAEKKSLQEARKAVRKLSASRVEDEQKRLGTPAGQYSASRTEIAEQEYTEVSMKYLSLQKLFEEERGKVETITERIGMAAAFEKMRAAQELKSLRDQLEQKSADMRTIVWKMNELHMAGKSSSDQLRNRIEHIAGLERQLIDSRNNTKLHVEGFYRTNRTLQEDVGRLEKLVKASSTPIWHLPSSGSAPPPLSSRIVAPFSIGNDILGPPKRKLSVGEVETWPNLDSQTNRLNGRAMATTFVGTAASNGDPDNGSSVSSRPVSDNIARDAPRQAGSEDAITPEKHVKATSVDDLLFMNDESERDWDIVEPSLNTPAAVSVASDRGDDLAYWKSPESPKVADSTVVESNKAELPLIFNLDKAALELASLPTPKDAQESKRNPLDLSISEKVDSGKMERPPNEISLDADDCSSSGKSEPQQIKQTAFTGRQDLNEAAAPNEKADVATQAESPDLITPHAMNESENVPSVLTEDRPTSNVFSKKSELFFVAPFPADGVNKDCSEATIANASLGATVSRGADVHSSLPITDNAVNQTNSAESKQPVVKLGIVDRLKAQASKKIQQSSAQDDATPEWMQKFRTIGSKNLEEHCIVTSGSVAPKEATRTSFGEVLKNNKAEESQTTGEVPSQPKKWTPRKKEVEDDDDAFARQFLGASYQPDAGSDSDEEKSSSEDEAEEKDSKVIATPQSNDSDPEDSDEEDKSKTSTKSLEGASTSGNANKEMPNGDSDDSSSDDSSPNPSIGKKTAHATPPKKFSFDSDSDDSSDDDSKVAPIKTLAKPGAPQKRPDRDSSDDDSTVAPSVAKANLSEKKPASSPQKKPAAESDSDSSDDDSTVAPPVTKANLIEEKPVNIPEKKPAKETDSDSSDDDSTIAPPAAKANLNDKKPAVRAPPKRFSFDSSSDDSSSDDESTLAPTFSKKTTIPSSNKKQSDNESSSDDDSTVAPPQTSKRAIAPPASTPKMDKDELSGDESTVATPTNVPSHRKMESDDESSDSDSESAAPTTPAIANNIKNSNSSLPKNLLQPAGKPKPSSFDSDSESTDSEEYSTPKKAAQVSAKKPDDDSDSSETETNDGFSNFPDGSGIDDDDPFNGEDSIDPFSSRHDSTSFPSQDDFFAGAKANDFVPRTEVEDFGDMVTPAVTSPSRKPSLKRQASEKGKAQFVIKDGKLVKDPNAFSNSSSSLTSVKLSNSSGSLMQKESKAKFVIRNGKLVKNDSSSSIQGNEPKAKFVIKNGKLVKDETEASSSLESMMDKKKRKPSRRNSLDSKTDNLEDEERRERKSEMTSPGKRKGSNLLEAVGKAMGGSQKGNASFNIVNGKLVKGEKAKKKKNDKKDKKKGKKKKEKRLSF